MNPALRRTVTVSAAFLLPFLIGVLDVARNEWFGDGDLLPYALYCIPFALFLWLSSSISFRIASRWPRWLATSSGVLFGALVGFAGTLIVAVFLGPWFGAMSVPVLKSWCIAAAVFIPVTHLLRKDGFRGSRIAGPAAFAALGVALFFGFSPLWSLATGNQHLVTAFFRHVPGEAELEIPDAPEWLSEEDRTLIQQSGLTGHLQRVGGGGSNSTEWPRAKAYVIFTSDLSSGLRLPQPKHSTIVYVQREDGFVPIPSSTPTFDRKIEVYQGPAGWAYWIELSCGAKSGAGLNL